MNKPKTYNRLHCHKGAARPWRAFLLLPVVSSLLLLVPGACAIHNDIPYPTVESAITGFEVEGQCDESGNTSTEVTINKSAYTVTLYVDDTVDLSQLRITKLTYSNDAVLSVDPEVCSNYDKFPSVSFSSLDDLPMSADTRVDFTNPVHFTLTTYQDYVWTVNVQQVVNRTILLDGQIGDPVIDDINHTVVVYVSQDMDISALEVMNFDLGGPNGTVEPDPMEYGVYDFSAEPTTFNVKYGWQDTYTTWNVFVFESEQVATDADVFARVTSATLTGAIQNGLQPTVEYKRQSASSWTTLSTSAVTVSGTTYTAQLTGLTANTAYQYRVTVNGTTGSTQSFTTAKAVALTDADFDNWHLDGDLYCPWAEGSDSFWDTGNKGSTTVGSSISVPTEDTCNGKGLAAQLSSKWIIMKFGAGSIFTGSYVRTDGTNGVLSFGQPFTSFPSKLRVNYKYDMVTIDHVGDDELENLKGRPDSCHIYIALTDWDEPFELHTRPSERHLFDKTDPNVIAYAELIKGETVSSWTQTDLTLDYRYTDRTPKYILVVCAASKYGDYFTGGSGSTLYVDNFELIYE